MSKNSHHCRQHHRYDCHAHRAEQTLFLLVFCSNAGLQILCSGDRPCVRVPHPETIDQKTVNEIHNGQDDKQLPEARRKAARTVYPIDTDQHIADIAGNADCFEQQAVASDAFRACKPQFYAPLLHRRAVKIHHPNSPLTDARSADQNQQNSHPKTFQNHL